MTTQHKEHTAREAPSPHILPVSLHDPSTPLVKIYTCGGLQIEVLQSPASSPTQAQYAPAVPLSGHGVVVPAQLLLKHLLSAPQRYRSVDWLKEYWYGNDELPGRLYNPVSLLRGLLCPPYLQGRQHAHARKQLVSLVVASEASGNGYRLGAYPLIWTDIDALDWNVAQACRMERYDDDPLPFWERAYHLASQGEYLPEERYSDWAEPRRLAVIGALRQSVHALKRQYLLQYGQKGQAEVLRVLRDYLLQFPTDEDALRFLMELLAQQERFQEVEQVFERTKRSREEEGVSLDARTLDMWTYLHTKQLQRHRMNPLPPLHGEHLAEHGEHAHFFTHLSEAITVGIVKAMEQRERHKRDAAERCT